MSASAKLKYRPEIDGLRALAVLAVVFYHAGLGIPGGFIGVDIFFVISGFLITSLILKDLEAGSFSMVHFWERRARRILPASTVMILITAALGWFLLPPSGYVAFAESATAQAVFAANIYFWRTTNYFAGASGEQPLLHMWSLAVEEQFYFFVPLLLLLVYRPNLRRRKQLAFASLGICFAFSLVLSMWLLPRMPAATFYLLPTRAWEMLCGALISVVPARLLTQSRWHREVLCLVGILAMVVPCFTYSNSTPFPGLAALPPCVGAALFIIGCSQMSGVPLPKMAYPFTLRPMVSLGLISYSLYLWHWPIIAFINYWALEDITVWQRWVVIAASLLLGYVSWRFVETPFRVRSLGASRRSMFSYAGIGQVALLCCGFCLIFANGFPGRFSERVNSFDQVKSEYLLTTRIYKPISLNDAQAGAFPTFGFPPPRPIDLLVWGGSHAFVILPGVLATADVHQCRLSAAWHSSTPPALDYIPQDRFSMEVAAPNCAELVVKYIQQERIPAVLLAAKWSEYFAIDLDRDKDYSTPKVGLEEALLKTIHVLRSMGTEVWILREVPNHRVAISKALMSSEIFGTNLSSFQCGIKDLAEQNAEFDRIAPKLEAAGANIIDVSDLLRSTKGDSFMMERDGIALYFDQHHLTRDGARLVAPAFEAVLQGK